jgi:phage baseplate assembly protein W
MAEQSLKISKLYKDLDLSFTPNPVTGDVSKKIDANAVKQSLKTLILTNYYERLFQPEKGGNLRGLLFEPLTPQIANTITKVIENLIVSYEKRVKLTSVTANTQLDNNSYGVTIRYYIVGIEKPQVFNTELERLR